MHVISAKAIRLFANRNIAAREPLSAWLAVTEKANWSSIRDVRRVFPHADSVKVKSGREVIVFNIKGNIYRLITAIHFNRGKVFALRFLTHAEYDKDA